MIRVQSFLKYSRRLFKESLQILTNINNSLQEKRILRSQKLTHREASLVLIRRFPQLLKSKEDFPYIISGIHSWQLEALPSINVPSIDVAFTSQGFFFSFLPDIGDSIETEAIITLSSRRLLEEVFRRRLRLSKDLSPLLPIFTNPKLIITIKDDEQLKCYIDHCWHKALLWGMSQLPEINEEIEIHPTTWMSRRLFLEEASRVSLFR